MNHTQRIKEHIDAARLARHGRDFLTEYQNLFQAANIWEETGNFEQAAKYYIAAAKACRKTEDADAGIAAGEKAVKCFVKRGQSNYALGLYEDMIRILKAENFEEKAVILHKKKQKLLHQLKNT